MLRLYHHIMLYLDDNRFAPIPGHNYACVVGYGGIVADLFQNLKQCPGHIRQSDCYSDLQVIKGASWRDVHLDLKARTQYHPDLFKLNETFVNHIFEETGSLFRAQDLQESFCAVHVRFGDRFSRKEEEMDERARNKTAKSKGRACRADRTNVFACFASLAKEVRRVCPDPSVPTYLAADVPKFVEYFCEEEVAAGRIFLSSCTPNLNETNHINDVAVPLINKTAGYSINPQGLPTLLATLRDWLALALAQNMTCLGGSSFSESAAYVSLYRQD